MPETPHVAIREGARDLRARRRPPAARRVRPDLDLRRRPADRDPGQGPRADRPLGVLVHASSRRSSRTTCSRIRDDGRSMECRRLEMLPIECVVRGYLAGSGWKDYRATGATSAAIALPEGLRESDRLPEPIFTPATKAQTGHDENITREQAAELVGEERLAEVERVVARALRDGRGARARAAASSSPTRSSSSGSTRTATSSSATRRSRPTPRASGPPTRTSPGGAQPSFDKQFVRDYCETTGWDKTDPGPGAARRRRRRDAREVRRGVRAADGRPVRPLPRRSLGRAAAGHRPMRATVVVRPKAGILDPQGEAVRSALAHLGFSVADARVGKVVDLELEAADADDARAQVERMCEQLLANPLIESYEVEMRWLAHSRGSGCVTYPGSNDDRDALWALAALDAEAVPVWHDEARAARPRRGRPARRLLVRRLPALRRDRPLLARDDRGHRRRSVRSRRSAGSRRRRSRPAGRPRRGRAAPPPRAARPRRRAPRAPAGRRDRRSTRGTRSPDPRLWASHRARSRRSAGSRAAARTSAPRRVRRRCRRRRAPGRPPSRRARRPRRNRGARAPTGRRSLWVEDPAFV